MQVDVMQVIAVVGWVFACAASIYIQHLVYTRRKESDRQADMIDALYTVATNVMSRRSAQASRKARKLSGARLQADCEA